MKGLGYLTLHPCSHNLKAVPGGNDFSGVPHLLLRVQVQQPLADRSSPQGERSRPGNRRCGETGLWAAPALLTNRPMHLVSAMPAIAQGSCEYGVLRAQEARGKIRHVVYEWEREENP